MDMWEPFIQSTLEAVHLNSSNIFFDRFHVMQHMGEAVDIVRRPENRLLIADGDDRLKDAKYLWISSHKNVHTKRRAEFRFLRGSDLKTSPAWAIKESLWRLWTFRVEGWACGFFSQWSGWAVRSRLEPTRNVARMMNRRLRNIISHCRHQPTNAVAEGLNSKTMAIKRRAGGYRNVGTSRTDLLLLRRFMALPLKILDGPVSRENSGFDGHKARMAVMASARGYGDYGQGRRCR